MRSGAAPVAQRVSALLAERTEANRAFFAAEAERVARLCHEMSERFARGGRLLAVGSSPAARSDARHVAVEFVHPVIVGKRALPAVAFESPEQAALLAGPDDMVLAFDGAAPEGIFEVRIPDPPSDDPFVRQELTETYYHLLWELVHVFFEHGGRQSAGAGAASFLYPFLAEQATDVEAVITDIAGSVRMKAQEVDALRAQTLTEGADTLEAAAAELRVRFDAGGTLLALGNGGSATDAMDVVADFRAPPEVRGWPPRRALDLTEDPAIITALANDIGTDAIFSRQVIAYGGPGDALIALSTSGNSLSVISALIEARRRGLATIACVGYGGGRVAEEELADHVIVTRSEHIPRIQEAQASAYHVLRELVEAEG
ncbi:MAG: D-sedoheptulose 7-phosphate isomerase [Pseudonocardiales bacterium]|nr:D-sedoheptulose 7-phosphate isomerase [Pseudonocardiales bacterium]